MKKVAKPEHGSLEWLQIRHRDEYGRIRFGASEAPVLMGVSKYKNVIDLAVEKWADPEVKPQNEAMQRGHILEPALLEYASQLLNAPVVTPDEMYSVGRFIATLDGLADNGETIVEAKTTTAYSSDDELPVEYYWQVIAQLACCPDAQRAIVIVLDKRMRFGHWVVERRFAENDIDLLLARADEVGDLLDDGTIPGEAEPTETQIKALYPTPAGEVEMTADQFQMFESWCILKKSIAEMEATEKHYRDKLAAMLADKDTATYSGQKVLTFKARKGSVRIDTKRLEQDHPDLVQQYKTYGGSTRILRTTGEF